MAPTTRSLPGPTTARLHSTSTPPHLPLPQPPQVIGKQLGKRISVRQFVGINSGFTRAMRVVLSDRGVTFAKAMVLVGGPDWPTSVLTGIMRLSCPQMLLGSLPIIMTIVPSVMAGAFNLLTTINNTWAALSTILAMVLMVVQGGATMAAAIVIERANSKRKEEVDAVPVDEEVKKCDDAEAAFNAARRDVTHWQHPRNSAAMRFLLILSAVVMILTWWATILLTPYAKFDVGTAYSMLGWRVWEIFLIPLGWLTLFGYVFCWVARYIYQRWAKKAALAELANPTPAGWLQKGDSATYVSERAVGDEKEASK